MKRSLTRLLAVAQLTALTMALSGCWDSRELKEQAFASVLAIDKGDKMKYRLTLQVPKPASPTEASGPGPSFTVFSQEGESISECITDMTLYTSRRPNLSHLKLIAVGEEVAKSVGLKDIVNIGYRSREIRSTAVVALAEGKAQALTEIQPVQEKSPSTYYADLFAQSSIASVTYPTTLHEVIINALIGTPSSPVVPFLTPKSTGSPGAAPGAPDAVTAAGTAVFRRNKYVGRMSEYETQGWLLMTGHMSSSIVPVKFGDGRVVSMIREGSTVTSVRHKGDTAHPTGIRIVVKIDVDADIVEINTSRSYVVGSAGIDKLDKALAGALESRCRAAIKRSKELNVDTFQFGRNVRSEMKLSDFIKLHWADRYPNTDIEVHVTAHVRRSGGLFGNVATSEGQ